MKSILAVFSLVLSMGMAHAEDNLISQSTSSPAIKKSQPTQSSTIIPSKFCGPTAEINLLLANNYQEKLVFIGKSSQAPGLIKIYTNSETDTWTLVVSYYHGQTCIFDNGNGYRHSQLELKE